MFQEEEPEQVPEIDMVVVGARVEAAEDALSKLGLHLDQWQPAPMASPDGKPMILMNLMIGDIAFSDRVQNPQKVEDDRTIIGMDQSFNKDKFKENVAKAKALLEENEDD